MIAFRVDAHENLATGHLFRCIAIAKECRKIGITCIFLLAENKYTEVLEKNEFEYEILNISPYDWNRDVSVLKNYLINSSVKCLVVDSYKVNEAFFQEIFGIVPVFYLDDICDTAYKVNAVLHYSEWENERTIADLYRGTGVSTYSGMRYMPLREEFRNKKINDKYKYDVLITTGGTDSFHITKKVLEKMNQEVFFRNKSVCAVLGKMNTDKAEIYEMKSISQLTVLCNISNMDQVMRESRVAACAAGTTVYELMASSTPFVCFGFSDDQIIFGEKLNSYNHALWAGDARMNPDVVAGKIVDDLIDLLGWPKDKLEERSRANKGLVDGDGASRIAKILYKLRNEEIG